MLDEVPGRRRPARAARETATGAPLLSLRGIRREYPAGEETVTVLRGVDLDIRAGEMVAIMGASGSGKSTLMNILGCLDRASEGTYAVNGQDVEHLDADALAALRREHFGFIFQRYHLLPELTALGNVEIPAIYAGATVGARRTRARELLGRLGMGARLDHRPGQLSGGQQQRVSIARALMNDADIILADEPTGALDSHSGEEVLRILEELHAGGRTIVLVTHDPKVAARAERVIEVSDGQIISDTRTARGANVTVLPTRGRERAAPPGAGPLAAARTWLGRLREAFRMALLSMAAHRLRSFLTMLGIVIGIASVVNVVALGRGSQERVLANISNLGTNTLEIMPGQDMGDVRSGRIKTLIADDAKALAREPFVVATTPTVQKSVNLRYGSIETSSTVIGASEDFFLAKGMKIRNGAYFDADAVAARDQVVVIDLNARDLLFPNGENPVGKVILVGRMPARVIGVAERQATFGNTTNPVAYMPYTAVQTRLIGDTSLRGITVRVSDDVDMLQAQQAVTAFLTARHGAEDFFIINNDDIRQTITTTANTLALLIAAIAVISLVVGGIGVMNIMLVSVSERVSEIGVRLAVGGRRGDILQQFLVEAVVLCLVGGVLGILFALGIGWVITVANPQFALVYSSAAMLAAVASATAIGVVFGYLPARRAAELDPVVALSRA